MVSNRVINLKKEYDVIIIGGGIYGATLLWEATCRGLSAVLIEKGDFCSATSSNSLKIIHGGLRYLQSLDFKRIRESANEQNFLIKIAPHLIQPLACVIPTYSKIKTSKLAMALAFKSYEVICHSYKGNNEKLPSSRILSNKELHEKIPILKPHGATGGALWHDALNFNSERLTLEFILSACDHGADAFNYMESQNLILRKNAIKGVHAYDKLLRQELTITGKWVINAAGPWADKICEKINLAPRKKRPFQFAKAVNLIIPRVFSECAFGISMPNQSIDDLSQSNRYFFFVPWRSSTLIGTWYFAYSGSPEEAALDEGEYFKCIRQVQRLIPDADIKEDEVCFVHSGLVATNEPFGNNKFVLKNRYALIDHSVNGGPKGLITVLGIKYTTARNVAAKTIDLLSRKLNRTKGPGTGGSRLRAGEGIGNINKFIQGLNSGKKLLSNETIKHLSLNYGQKYFEIEKLIYGDAELGRLIPGSKEAIAAELYYCIKNEFAYHLSDLLLRRTDIGSMKKPKDETIEFTANFMAKEMGWSESQKYDEIRSLEDFYNKFLVFQQN